MNIPAYRYWGKLCTYNVICSFQGHHSTVSTLRDILFTQTWKNVLISKSGMDHHFILPTHQIPYPVYHKSHQGFPFCHDNSCACELKRSTFSL